MPYKLIKGSFHIYYPENPNSGPEPDGDTIKFQPDNRLLIEQLPRPNAAPKFNLKGITSIRYEGIDALETHFSVEGDTFHQQYGLAVQARDVLLAKMGFGNITYFPDKPYRVQSVEHNPVEGYILSNGVDTYGRTIAFVFVGPSAFIDGANVFMTPEMLDSSLNVFMLKSGNAYGEFYLTLPAELRDYLTGIVTAARQAGTGVWATDTVSVTKSAVIPGLDVLQALVLWPKLFRRLVAYFQSGFTGLSSFDSWLRADPKDRDDRLILPNRELGNMHDLLVVTGDSIRMQYLPEAVVIVPDDYQLPTTPVPVPLPEAGKAIIRIIAALVNPLEKTERGHETVTLLNTTSEDIDLAGWFVADRTNKQPLEGIIAKGDTLRVKLGSKVQLSNVRDTISILDKTQTLIHQVSYESKGLPEEGHSVVF